MLGPATNENRAAAREHRVRPRRSLPLDERDEERRVRDVKKKTLIVPHEEGDDVQLLDRQLAERVRERNRGEQSGARTRSVKIIVCRLLPRLSTQAPAWSAKNRFGTSSAAMR